MTSSGPSALRLAATAIPLRESAAGLEVLMVERNPNLSFGGMWAFPGGSIDSEDGPVPPMSPDENATNWGAPRWLATAAMAAVRETNEETGLQCATASLSWFSHWIPPSVGPRKRFSTWFFLAPDPTGDLDVDHRESRDARWLRPMDALQEYSSGEFPMAVPTWVTLHDLANVRSVGALIDHTITQGPRIHHTRAVPNNEGVVLVWEGDVAHETGDLAAAGPRNRVLVDSSFTVLERISGVSGA